MLRGTVQIISTGPVGSAGIHFQLKVDSQLSVIFENSAQSASVVRTRKVKLATDV